MLGLRARAQRQFGHQRAVRRDAVRQFAVPGGIDAVDARAHDRHGAGAFGAGLQRSFVGSAVDAQGQPADHAPAVGRQVAGERAGVLAAAGRGIARAHHRQRGPLQEGRIAGDVEQDRRVRDREQALGVGGVRERQDVAARIGGPFQRGIDLGRHVGGHRRGQLARERFGHVPRQRRGAVGVYLFGQAERAEQRAGGGGADIRLQGQPQPGGHFGGGLRKRHVAGARERRWRCESVACAARGRRLEGTELLHRSASQQPGT
ncbi:hypothetical protein D9M69_531840 [compost metagenome]